MAISWVFYAGAASQALPPIAALRHGRALPTARRWIVLWAVVLLVYDSVGLALALQRKRNLWLGDIVGPFEVVTILMALAVWQLEDRRRVRMKSVIPIFVAIWCFLLVFVEASNSYTTIANSFKSLVLLSASVVTLLLAIRVEEGNLDRQDWFWISIGLALKYGAEAAIEPLSSMLLDSNPELVVAAFKVKSLVTVAASLVIARGILCPIPPPRPSSGPMSPASSPSPSSSPPSARRW